MLLLRVPADLSRPAVASHYRTPEGLRLDVAGVGVFDVRRPDGDCRIDRVPDCNEADVQAAIEGPVAIMRDVVRGVVSLHGSCVAIGSVAAAFIGPGKAGKSTLAGAFLERGHRLLSDDVVPIDTVAPADASIRLWTDSAEQLEVSGPSTKVVSWASKRRVGLKGQASLRKRPPDVVYVLAPRAEPCDTLIESVEGTAAGVALLANLSGSGLLDSQELARATARVLEFADRVAVRQATYHRSYGRLADLAKALETDALAAADQG